MRSTSRLCPVLYITAWNTNKELDLISLKQHSLLLPPSLFEWGMKAVVSARSILGHPVYGEKGLFSSTPTFHSRTEPCVHAKSTTLLLFLLCLSRFASKSSSHLANNELQILEVLLLLFVPGVPHVCNVVQMIILSFVIMIIPFHDMKSHFLLFLIN